MLVTIVLYCAAAFIETGMGICIFGRMFPKRKSLERKQKIAEGLLFLCIMLCVWSFSKEYLGEGVLQRYIPLLLLAYLFFFLFAIVCVWKRSKQGYKHGSALQIFLFAAIVIMNACQYWDSYISSLHILLGGILQVLFLYAYYETLFVQAYLWQFCLLTNIGLLKSVYIVYAGTFQNRRFEDFLWHPRTHMESEVIYFLMICVVAICIVKCLSIDRIMKEILKKHKTILFLVTIGEWLLLFILVDNGEGSVKEKNLTIALIVVTGIMLLFLTLCAKLLVKNTDTEKKLLDVRNAAMESQYYELSQVYESFRCVVHDEKHVLLYVRECLKNGDVQEAMRFLECRENIMNCGKRVWTGIQNVDIMLNMKKRRMDELEIAFRLDAVIDEIPMDDADFIVLLGNLFDNAIDAVKKCEEGRREILLTMKNVNEMFLLKMRNTNAMEVQVKNNRFITDKKDAGKHGWGIESVKRMVGKYGGTITFTYDKNYFEVLAVINSFR